MATHGVIDAKTWPADTTKTLNERYVTIVDFLLSAHAASLGISQVASYYGSTGTGHGYWDQSPHVSDGAFTVWAFNNATVPFYMLVSYNAVGNTQVGNSNPCAQDDRTAVNGLYFAFAQRVDGTNPWNGSTNVNGLDTKGTPVWTPGGSNLYAWPRTNSVGGSRSTNVEDAMGTGDPGTPVWTRFHFFCDENHVLLASDEQLDGGYAFTFFGKYTPRNGTTPACPYIALRSNTSYGGGGQQGENPPFPTTTYPHFSGYSVYDYNGGIAHPSDPTKGVLTAQPDYMPNLAGAQFFPTPATGQVLELPIPVGMSEGSSNAGYCGYIDWIRYSWGMANQSMTSDKLKAFLGSMTLQAWKLSVPWDGVTSCGTGQTREGTQF